MLLVAFSGQVFAQEQFFTQSGGRGLQNAKTNARLSKVESDVDVLNVEMAKVKPHAKAELGACSDTAEKLRYDGNNWICERETDPTVQEFAKKPLPSCTGGTILSAVGGEFGCSQPGYVSTETDPTVQAFAKSPLPSCSAHQLLTVGPGGGLQCVNDEIGVTREQDPNVYDFARNDAGTLPNCNGNEVLTMTAARLSCKPDVGITEEVDPRVASFARTDIAGYTLAACATGEMLQATTNADGKVILQCFSVQASLAEALALDDLSDVSTAGQVSGSVLMYSGGSWKALQELDPNVQAWAKTSFGACTAGQVVTYDGTSLSCVDDAGGSNSPLNLADLGDVNVTGVAGGKFLKYDGTATKWVPGTVEEFAQTVLPTCGTGEVLSGDGTNLTCVDDAGGSNDPLDLVELGDVRTSASQNLAPSDKDFLRWKNSATKWEAVHDKLSGTLTSDKWCYYNGTDVVCDRGEPSECDPGEILSWNATAKGFACVTANTALGLGTISTQNADAVEISGGTIDGTAIGASDPSTGKFTDLQAQNIVATALLRGAATDVSSLLVHGNGWVHGNFVVDGNFMVSGSQTIEGVSFANGGVSATGTVSATMFSGDGSGLTNIQVGALQAAGVVGSVQVKGVDNKISGTDLLVWDSASSNLTVSGTLKVAGSGSEPCSLGAYGTMRIVNVGSNDYRMQFCRP